MLQEVDCDDLVGLFSVSSSSTPARSCSPEHNPGHSSTSPTEMLWAFREGICFTS
jgi:hypothetical protein